MNLYNPGAPIVDSYEGFNSVNRGEEDSKKKMIKDFLDSLPDYGFLLDTKLSIPKELFVE